MNAKHLHPSASKNPAAVRRDASAGTPAASPAVLPGRACCCPAKAAVRVIMPPVQGRPETDLLLCGHHYLVSRRALSAAGASVHDLPGTPPDVAAWIREAA